MELGNTNLFSGIIWVILIYMVISQSSYFCFLVLSIKPIQRYLNLVRTSRFFAQTKKRNFVPPISIIVPAYNEYLTIVKNAKEFINIEYPEFEIIIINDGSTDSTLEQLQTAFSLLPIDQVYSSSLKTKSIQQIYHSLQFPQLIIVDKENGGKADAINAGINVSRYPLFCVVDADSILEMDSLIRIVYPFVELPEEIVAVGGIVRIGNGTIIQNGQIMEAKLPSSHWARIQVMEYLRAFLFGRIPWSSINCLLIIAGAFSVFRKSAVIEIGGFLTNTVGEDMEITVRLHRYRYEKKKKWSIKFIPDPVCWTQAPEDRKTLKNQRNRWHRGLAETLWRHRKMFCNPKYGIVGLIGMPYFVFFELLSPLFDLVGILSLILQFLLGTTNIWFTGAVFGLLFLYSQINSACALLLQEYSYPHFSDTKEFVVLFFYSWVEGFYFRLLNSWWKFQALFQITNNKNNWGAMKRTSFQTTRENGIRQADRTTQELASGIDNLTPADSLNQVMIDHHDV